MRDYYEVATALDLPGIVRPIALERSDRGGLALILPDEGLVSLEDYRIDGNRTSTDDGIQTFWAIALQLAEILDDIHRHRVIHKDIKPSNVLIHPAKGQVKLTDFGLSSQLPQETQEIQNPTMLKGTLAYMSPEQTGRMNRGIDYRSDFYALGVTFYELLTGQLPFQGEDPLELVYCHLAREPVVVEAVGRQAKDPGNTATGEIPKVLADIVRKLMAKNAEDRYQSALGLKADLEICLEQYVATGTIGVFPLGQVDTITQFNIPQKLYGRESQVQVLLDAFERVSQGSCELVMVGDYSRIGKTALVNELLRQLTLPITRRRLP